MKKIAFILALIMILGSAFWGCDTAETDTTGQAGESSENINKLEDVNEYNPNNNGELAEETKTQGVTETSTCQNVVIKDLIYVSNGDGTCYVKGLKNDFGKDDLVSVIIPELSPYGDVVVGIGNGAFRDIQNLESVEMSDSVIYIGEDAFSYCKRLKSIQLSDNLLVIDRMAFSVCDQLQTIKLPQKLTRIGDYAFLCCDELDYIFIPAQVTSIGLGIFQGSNNLSDITVDPENPVFYSSNNCIINKETKSVIAGCKDSIIPQSDDVTCIASEAFCFDFSIFVIPNNIKKIERNAIRGTPGSYKFETIVYTGTIEAWEMLVANNPNLDDLKYRFDIYCTDGMIPELSKG